MAPFPSRLDRRYCRQCCRRGSLSQHPIWVKRIVLETGQASVSMVQRRLGLGYTRAARLIDMMEDDGIVGPYRGAKPREILVKQEASQGTEKEGMG